MNFVAFSSFTSLTISGGHDSTTFFSCDHYTRLCMIPEPTEDPQTPVCSPGSETESDADSDGEDYQFDSEDDLHGPCGETPTGCDPEFRSQ